MCVCAGAGVGVGELLEGSAPNAASMVSLNPSKAKFCRENCEKKLERINSFEHISSPYI